MFSSEPNNNGTNSLPNDSQNMSQTSGDKPEEVIEAQSEQKPTPDQPSGHYWWCPYFPHQASCQYMYYGFQDPNQWPQMMSYPYSIPSPQMQKNCNESMGSVETDQKSRESVANKSPKSKTNVNEIERLYSCRLCSEIEETKDTVLLRQHIEQHLGKCRPFVCRICGKDFKFRSNCRNHLMAHCVVRKNYNRVYNTLIQNSN